MTIRDDIESDRPSVAMGGVDRAETLAPFRARLAPAATVVTGIETMRTATREALGSQVGLERRAALAAGPTPATFFEIDARDLSEAHREAGSPARRLPGMDVPYAALGILVSPAADGVRVETVISIRYKGLVLTDLAPADCTLALGPREAPPAAPRRAWTMPEGATGLMARHLWSIHHEEDEAAAAEALRARVSAHAHPDLEATRAALSTTPAGKGRTDGMVRSQILETVARTLMVALPLVLLLREGSPIPRREGASA